MAVFSARLVGDRISRIKRGAARRHRGKANEDKEVAANERYTAVSSPITGHRGRESPASRRPIRNRASGHQSATVRVPSSLLASLNFNAIAESWQPQRPERPAASKNHFLAKRSMPRINKCCIFSRTLCCSFDSRSNSWINCLQALKFPMDC